MDRLLLMILWCLKVKLKFFEKVALRAILRYNVLTHLGNLENVVSFVLKCIHLNFHNYWSNIRGELIQNVKKIVMNFLCKTIIIMRKQTLKGNCGWNIQPKLDFFFWKKDWTFNLLFQLKHHVSINRLWTRKNNWALGTGESTRDIAGALNHSQSQVAHAIKAFKEEDWTTIASPKNINELVFYLMDEWVVIICKN